MGEKKEAGEGKHKTTTRERTIALLGTNLNFEIPVRIFREIRGLAQQYNYNLLYFVGGPLHIPHEFDVSTNILYNFITPKIVDGLILISNLLSTYITPGFLREKCLQYHPVPVVSLGLALEGFPSVVMNNSKGMYDVVYHLIKDHQYTRIAFLSGPREHPDTIERFKAFTRAMKEYGVPVDQSLFLQGDFHFRSGSAAVKELIDNRGKKPGRDVQAIVCCNDYMATGVMQELHVRGIRIPEEIALTGFDDIDICECLTPTISTVRQPFNTMAARAVELLIKFIGGKPVPDVVQVDSQFSPRRSCGCPDNSVDDNGTFIVEDVKKQLKKTSQGFLEYINQEFIATNALLRSAWKKILSHLYEKDKEIRKSGIEHSIRNFGRTTKILLEETARYTFDYNRYQKIMYDTGLALIKTLDLSELLKIIIKNLPRTGIRNCCICLYENPGYSTEVLPPWSRLILAFNPAGTEKLPPSGLRFETARLLPEEIIIQQKGFIWVIYNLYYQQEQIGYIMLDSGENDEKIYHDLASQISSTLKGALLYRESQELYTKVKNENLHIKAEMEVARKIQTTLLPHDVSEIHPDFQFTASMLPAEEVGGDYYDIVLDKEGVLWLGIGDVSGHGLKSGLIMILAQTVHTTITTNYNVNPGEALIMINRVLIKNITNRMQETNYMTCVLLKYQGNGSFHFAGLHLDLLIYRQGTKSCERLETDGMWLNVIDDITSHTKNLNFKLEVGDVLVLYSDGVTESCNEHRKRLETKGLMGLVVRHGEKEVEEMKQGILEDVLAWNKGKPRDDITLVLARRIH